MRLQLVLVALAIGGVLTCGAVALATEAKAEAGGPGEAGGLKGAAGALSAGLVGAVGILAAAWAVGRVGSSAVGAIAEKPELFVRALIFVAIAEGLAVFAFVLAYLLMSL